MSGQQHSCFDNDVIADINYFPKLGTPIPVSSWKPRYLAISDTFTRPMLIRDVRQSSKTFKLDTHGFQYLTLPQKERVGGHSDEETIRREYYPEVEEIAMKLYVHTTNSKKC